MEDAPGSSNTLGVGPPVGAAEVRLPQIAQPNTADHHDRGAKSVGGEAQAQLIFHDFNYLNPQTH